MRTYLWLEKFLVFVFLSVYVWHDSGHRSYPIRLKFGTNVYTLCEISFINFGVHWPNTSCTRIDKSIWIHYGLSKKKCLYSFLSACAKARYRSQSSRKGFAGRAEEYYLNNIGNIGIYFTKYRNILGIFIKNICASKVLNFMHTIQTFKLLMPKHA